MANPAAYIGASSGLPRLSANPVKRAFWRVAIFLFSHRREIGVRNRIKSPGAVVQWSLTSVSATYIVLNI